jgi:hypothetical protein
MLEKVNQKEILIWKFQEKEEGHLIHATMGKLRV